MSQAYIVAATRSALGRRNGSLAHVHPTDLGGAIMTSTLDQSGVDPGAVDDVIWGCLDAVGPQAHDIARTTWLSAGLPQHVPGVTIDRQCGSSQQAVHFAAQAVMSGTQDLVLAGGIQAMSQVPMNSSVTLAEGLGSQYSGKGWQARYGSQEVSQFRGAELVAEHWDLSREDLERFALISNERAVAAIDGGIYAPEITPVDGFSIDETPRRGTNLGRMAELAPIRPGGRVTAAAASQIADGAAALLIASEQAVRDHGLKPRARIHHMAVRADDPIMVLTAPIPATAHALQKAGMTIDEIDRFEVNEAFAPVVLAWLRETGADPAKVNVNGGAIALGHALGGTGARLMVSMLHELERSRTRYGLQTMCEAGGQANVTIIERL